MEIIFDRLLVGSWLGDLPLGLYNQARVLVETPMTATRTLGPPTFDLLSRLQGDPRRLSRAHMLLNHFLVRTVFAGAAVLLVYPAEIIRLLLGADWVAAASILRWLAIYAGLLPLAENMKQLLLGRGLVWQTIVMRLGQIGLFVPGIPLGIAYDRIDCVAGALVAAAIGGVTLARYYSRGRAGAAVVRLVAAPLAAHAGTTAFFSLDRWNLRGALPYWVLPALPALSYALLLGVMERGRLLTELRYLRGVLASGV